MHPDSIRSKDPKDLCLGLEGPIACNTRQNPGNDPSGHHPTVREHVDTMEGQAGLGLG